MVRHIVLLSCLLVLSLLAISYVFVLGENYRYTLASITSVHNSQAAIVDAHWRTSMSTAASVQSTLQPYMQTYTGASFSTLQAIALRIMDAQPVVQDITIYSANGAKVLGENATVNAKPNSITTTVTPEGWWHSYTVWLPITSAHTSPMVAVTFAAEPMLTALANNHAQIIEPYSVRVTLNSTTQHSVYIGNDHFQYSPLQQTNDSVAFLQRSIIPQYYSDLLWGEAIQVATTIVPNVMFVQTSVPVQFLHQSPRRLLTLMATCALLLSILSYVISASFTRSITQPLIRIAGRLQAYNPQLKNYQASVHTNDEIQDLDQAITSVTTKLDALYDDLELQVAKRTKSIEQTMSKEHALFDSINIGLLIVDTNGRIMEHNIALERLLQNDAIIDGTDYIDAVVPLLQNEITIAKEAHPIYQVLRTKEELTVQPDDHIVIALPNKQVPVRLVITPIINNQELIGAAIIVQDVTHDRSVDNMKNDFIALASHQLRTPLASIQWYSELLSQEGSENFTDEQREFVVELRLAAQRMSGVINELMDASRLHDDQIHVRPKACAVVGLLQRVAQDLHQSAQHRNITVQVVDAEAEVTIHTDPILLGIVCQNLLMNAIKYSHEGGTIRVQVTQNITHASILVSDDGIGIPQTDKDHIFNKLFRSANARRVDTNGSGLGLYASRKIMRQLGGSLTFTSIEGKGTTFIAAIPLAK